MKELSELAKAKLIVSAIETVLENAHKNVTNILYARSKIKIGDKMIKGKAVAWVERVTRQRDKDELVFWGHRILKDGTPALREEKLTEWRGWKPRKPIKGRRVLTAKKFDKMFPGK